MTYSKALNLILNKQSLGIKPGLERILSLLDTMDNPQDKIKIIHIAGTNGKGTVAATIASALKNAGYKTGLFSSPWVDNYREQIKINGEYISKNDFAEYTEKYYANDCTEFELLTAIMYKYFADNRVDYAVVECGMGGLGDSTNTEKKNISVITSVSIDHTAFLGNTLEEIALQKSGIIRNDCPCVLYPNPKCEEVFLSKAPNLTKVSEQGSFEKNNLATVNAVLSILGVTNVNKTVKLPARQEMIGNILLDGAHNVDGAKALASVLDNKKVTAVIGMMKDKDIDGYLSIIAPFCDRIITVSPNNSRAISADELKNIAKKYCKKVSSAYSAVDAINRAKQYNNFHLVCGSFYLAREVRNLLLESL